MDKVTCISVLTCVRRRAHVRLQLCAYIFKKSKIIFLFGL